MEDNDYFDSFKMTLFRSFDTVLLVLPVDLV